MSIEQLMTKEPVACTRTSSLSDAAGIMWEHDCGFVPVVESASDRRVVGVITDRDICMCAYTRGVELHALRVEDAMSRHVRSCKPGDSLGTAEARMREAQVRRLPVVDESDRLIGVLSISDLARRAKPRRGRQADDAPSPVEVGELLGSISQPRQLAAAAGA